MQDKFSIIVDYRVSCVRTALKANDNISLRREQIGHFAFSLIAKASACDCSYHKNTSKV